MIGRRIITLAAALLVSVAAAPDAAAKPKNGDVVIGYVSLQRAILEVEEGKRAKEQLKTAFEGKKDIIKAEEAKLMKLRDEIRKEASVKTDDALRARALEFEKKRYALQEQLMKEQKALQALEQKELEKITAKMRTVIDKIGKGGGYTLILELQDARLLFAKQHLDLTNEVIRKYNASHP